MAAVLSKRQMTEEDIKLQFITPAITKKWALSLITMETRITDGQINLRGNMVSRKEAKKADYREEITIGGFDKAKKYSVEELKARNYNIDLCGYPHEEEEILPPKELILQYQEKRASLNADIDRILAQITDILGIDITEEAAE